MLTFISILTSITPSLFLPVFSSPPSFPFLPLPPTQFFLVFGLGVHALCHWVLRRLATPHLGPQGELLDAGADLADNYISE